MPVLTDRTAVYRLFDADGQILYVGVTNDIGKRFMEHSRRAWWPEVTSRRVEWHDDRAAAMQVEAEAIRSERPIHNLSGAGGQSEGFRTGRRPKSQRKVEMLGVTAARPALSERLDLANLSDPTHTLLMKGNERLGAIVGMDWYRRARAALGEPTDL